MGKRFVILIALIAIFSYSTIAQIKVNSSGNVSIGNISPSGTYKLKTYGHIQLTPSGYSLDVDNSQGGLCTIRPDYWSLGGLGTSSNPFYKIYSSYPLIVVSDKRQKENLRDITGALDCIMNLKGWKYDLKLEILNDGKLSNDHELYKYLDADRKNKLGLLAQDVKKVLPEAVEYDSITDIYSIYYDHIIPVLIEAMKEQQTMIENLNNEISALKSESSDNLKSALITNNDNLNEQTDKPILFQNRPNPFNENTIINFYIPQNNQTATIFIYDIHGLQKKAYNITAKGKQSITIYGNEFSPGMYLYSLVVDGKMVEMRSMILTD